MFHSSQSNSNCSGMVNPLFLSDWRWWRPLEQSSTTLEFRNPTRKSCGRTLNTSEHKNGNFDVHRCVCCMQRLPYLGQPIKLERRMCFQKADPLWSFMNVDVFTGSSSPPVLYLSSNCHYCWWYEVEVNRQTTNLMSPKHSVVRLSLVVGNCWITNSSCQGRGQYGTTDSLMDLRHAVYVCVLGLTPDICLCLL